MDTQLIRRRRWSLPFAAAMLAAACGGGGGGGGGNAPPAPVDPPGAAVLSLEIGLKQLQFSWPAVTGATSYRLLANPDGASGFAQVSADIGGNETSVEVDVAVHLHDWDGALYMLDACNAGGCTASNEVGTLDGALEAIGYFKNSNQESSDNDRAVALSADGETLAVGAIGESSAATGIGGNQADDSADGAGAVYVFRRLDGVWAQQAYVKASNTDTLDLFGSSVALSADGSTLAVGAFGEDSGATGIDGNQADNSAGFAGAVYVFDRDDAGSWSQSTYIKASNAESNDRFGGEVALSADGNTLAVGASDEASAATVINGDESDNSAFAAGATYVFSRDADGAWSQEAYVKASNAGTDDHFGDEVALSGDGETLVVGARGEDSATTGIDGDQDDDSALSSGAVYVFVRDESGTWSQQAYVKAPNTDALDNFGRATELSDDGTTLVIAAPAEDSSASGVNGGQADNGSDNAGAAYVYARNGTVWSFQTYLKASNPEVSDLFGVDVALSGDGNTIAVGAFEEDGGSNGVGGNQADNNVDAAGAIYVFRRDGSGAPWTQRTYVKASNPDEGDQFGSGVCLSADGSTLAALSQTEASAATGIGGNQNDNTAPLAGAVYLY